MFLELVIIMSAVNRVDFVSSRISEAATVAISWLM
jgi:hypothetical protein